MDKENRFLYRMRVSATTFPKKINWLKLIDWDDFDEDKDFPSETYELFFATWDEMSQKIDKITEDYHQYWANITNDLHGYNNEDLEYHNDHGTWDKELYISTSRVWFSDSFWKAVNYNQTHQKESYMCAMEVWEITYPKQAHWQTMTEEVWEAYDEDEFPKNEYELFFATEEEMGHKINEITAGYHLDLENSCDETQEDAEYNHKEFEYHNGQEKWDKEINVFTQKIWFSDSFWKAVDYHQKKK